MLSFKKFINQLEEQIATTPTAPTTGTASSATTTPAGTKNTSTSTDISPQTRQKLDMAAKNNAAAMRLYQTGRTKEAVDTLRKDPNFQMAMQDLTKTSAPANASQLVNAALGGNP